MNIEALEQAAEQTQEAYLASDKALSALYKARTEREKPLNDKIAALRKALADIETETEPALNAARKERNTLSTARDKAHDALSIAYAREAIARCETHMDKADLIAGVNEAIGSTRTFKPNQTLGDDIVTSLIRLQLFRGVRQLGKASASGSTHTPGNRHGGVCYLTQAQADRAWDYLTSVCPVRKDGGLAPPFSIEPYIKD